MVSAYCVSTFQSSCSRGNCAENYPKYIQDVSCHNVDRINAYLSRDCRSKHLWRWNPFFLGILTDPGSVVRTFLFDYYCYFLRSEFLPVSILRTVSQNCIRIVSETCHRLLSGPPVVFIRRRNSCAPQAGCKDLDRCSLGLPGGGGLAIETFRPSVPSVMLDSQQ